MKDLAQEMRGLLPAISEILQVSGAAGASLGILHEDQVYYVNYGYRDVRNKVAPDENTIYHIACLSKSFTAAAIGILVDEKKLAWDQLVSEILPSFKHHDHVVRTQSTILDFMSHRVGLAAKNALWQQNGNELLLGYRDLMSTVSYLEVVEAFCTMWIYSHWNYDIGAEIVERASGTSYAAFLSEKILKPLNLNSTFLSGAIPRKLPQGNYAHGYMPLPDHRFTDVGRPMISDVTILQGAHAIKSNVKDLLKYYKAVVDTWKLEGGIEGLSVPVSPLKKMKDLLTGHIPLELDAESGQWYGMGWAIADLPAPLGKTGTNGMLLHQMPEVGKGTKETRVWYHNGSLIGFLSSVHILPETGSIIVVLVNSTPKNDCADWLGQLILEDLLDTPEKNDYISLATESASSYDRMWAAVEDYFKKPTPRAAEHPRPLKDYVGTYYNKPGNWHIEVMEEDGFLTCYFQGRRSQFHRLQPYGCDTFSWHLTEAEALERHRWPVAVNTYIFSFAADESESIKTLCWVHDPDVP